MTSHTSKLVKDASKYAIHRHARKKSRGVFQPEASILMAKAG